MQPILDEVQYDYEIASNYSILKTVAAIVQIGYGCYELYEARGTQINSFDTQLTRSPSSRTCSCRS